VSAPEPFFLPVTRGRRFCISHAPPDARAPAGAIVYVHPFAEEMNKARRMAALQARALAQAGWHVLQIDLFGCGDSEGEFDAATWEDWRNDVVLAAAWLRARTGSAPVLWGLRVGALLACEAVAHVERVAGLVLWQPVVRGALVLQQFLRLRLAAGMFEERATEPGGERALRDRLRDGAVVEVGGYPLSAAVADGLERADLQPPRASLRTAWLEVVADAQSQTAPASRARIDAWRQAGHRVDARTVVGLPFWQTQEIAECPALIDATVDAVTALAS
jgi:exosortase A-associated hydrolase 2